MEPTLEVGAPGAFEVLVDGKVVAGRRFWTFPSEEQIVAAVARALGK